MHVEGISPSNLTNRCGEKQEDTHKLEKSAVTTMIRTNSSNTDNEEFLMQHSCRSSDSYTLNRSKVTKFQKTGELLKKMKRQLSTQALEKSSHKDSSKINDKLTTQLSHSQLRTNDYLTNWEKIQKDQMTQAIMDEYEKQILRLKAELEDAKEEKKQVKQTLDKQRKFYMTEMYNKQLIIEEMDYQAQKLRGQIEKHVNLQYQFQQKIRLLQIENAEYRYQLDGWLNSSRQNQESMSAIYEENQDFCANSTGVSLRSRKGTTKMFMSLDNGFSHGNDRILDEDTIDLMRMAHQKEIQKYEKQIKNMKDYYQSKLKTYRRSMTPKKLINNNKNPIRILDEYICSDTISCQSQSKPENLRNILREQFTQGKSSKKVDDTTSFATTKYFMYPINSKKRISGQGLFTQETQENESEQFELKFTDMTEFQDKPRKQKLKDLFSSLMPSKQFMKGLGIGTASSMVALAVYKGLSNSAK